MSNVRQLNVVLLRLSGRSNPDCASDKILIKLSLKFVEFAFVKKTKCLTFYCVYTIKPIQLREGWGEGVYLSYFLSSYDFCVVQV